jgi:hypothetical protein
VRCLKYTSTTIWTSSTAWAARANHGTGFSTVLSACLIRALHAIKSPVSASHGHIHAYTLQSFNYLAHNTLMQATSHFCQVSHIVRGVGCTQEQMLAVGSVQACAWPVDCKQQEMFPVGSVQRCALPVGCARQQMFPVGSPINQSEVRPECVRAAHNKASVLCAHPSHVSCVLLVPSEFTVPCA